MADTVYVPVFAARQDFNVAFWLSDKRRVQRSEVVDRRLDDRTPEMAIPLGAFAVGAIDCCSQRPLLLPATLLPATLPLPLTRVTASGSVGILRC